MLNLLAQNTLGYSVATIDSIKLNWIGQLIRILIEGIGIVGVGIIVFTVILKCIVLPLDIYSRVSAKKQALIMDRMRDQMEKLQKQYANDEGMYRQKVSELQKKSGYSPFSACLPMLVSIVIFFAVFGAFSTYSQYANLENYNGLAKAYNGVVKTYVIDEEKNTGFLTPVYALETDREEGKDPEDYSVDFEKFAAYYKAGATQNEVFNELYDAYKIARPGEASSFSKEMVNQTANGELTVTAASIRVSLVSFYLEKPAAEAAKAYYEGHNNSFLWVKNLWYPDSSFNKEMPDFSKFKSTVRSANISDDYAESYAKVTSALGAEKERANGYFILIVLSIGLMLLQQFITMRSNKSVNELSTVNGQGASMNKYMLIIMPIFYGVISFTYSASFSLYMITNTLFGLITTLIINKSVDVWFKKKEANGTLDEVLNKKAIKRAKKAAARKRK